jgi:glutamate-5-semialdehyde dehydrogenase
MKHGHSATKSSNEQESIASQMQAIGQKAKEIALELSQASTDAKNTALRHAAKSLRQNEASLWEANEKDIAKAKEKNLDAAMIDRLELNSKRIHAIASGLEAIADLDDPVGRVLSSWTRPNGLKISRVSVPLGVIGIIYESRPNVTADAGGLCLKSGNAAILRGGSESFYSSKAIVSCLQDGLKAANLPMDCIQLVPTTNRQAVGEMLNMSRYIDVIVPRGGKGLCKRVQEESRVPTLLHLEGNCHSYIHTDADEAMALTIVENAKLRRTGICGATESLVIDQAIASHILPQLTQRLTNAGCELRGDSTAQHIDGRIKQASEEDWGTEYLGPIVSVRIVKDLEEAIDFINHYSSHHTDAIITNNEKAATTFLNRIDSAIVMHNASTQFADGGEFGMGAEIGIATGRLHARGPVGVEQLTTFKYQVEGNGQIRPL